MAKKKLLKKIFLVIILALLAVFLVFFRVHIKDTFKSFLKPSLPAPKSAEEFAKTQQVGTSATAEIVKQLPPAEVNLDVPFQSQAPFGNWDMPYQEACEEASAIMVHYYFAAKTLSAETMDEEILKLIDFENKTFGYYKDTTAAEIARIMKEYFGYKNVEVSYNFTIEDIKLEVASGRLVILPAAGRLLPNPNFRQPGPVYHALVIKGYMSDGRIITNDPGTRRGKDFLYYPQHLMNALHEWNAEDILKGRPAMIVVGG